MQSNIINTEVQIMSPNHHILPHRKTVTTHYRSSIGLAS